MFLYFEPSLDALSLRPDVVSSIKIISSKGSGCRGCWRSHSPLQNLSFSLSMSSRSTSRAGLGTRGQGSSLLGPLDPSFRALSGRLKFTVRRHEFNKDPLFKRFRMLRFRVLVEPQLPQELVLLSLHVLQRYVPRSVQGSGFRVQGSGSRVQGSGSRVQGSGSRVQSAWVKPSGA